ncbi:glycosyltransferase N-terminal domain-containing protein [Halobacteriovorax sp. ZH4_bin.1]|uniref:glycosyltransferase N-terminal domain-containing protein n=1 Tax=unclassified Halobacteriovorax TaxID=2639665 RepID=UPI00370FFCF0
MLLIFLIQAIVRVALYPIFIVLYLFKVGPFYGRISFERRNYRDEGCRPFMRFGKKAHCVFHFSSEGEFEQIRPLSDELISLGKNVELIFTSPSVEHKVLDYYQANRENVRYLRLPLMIYFPLLSRQNIIAWSSANKMMMVRYDFFPELLYLGSKMKEFILFSATVKSSRIKERSLEELRLPKVKGYIYSMFSKIICATAEDYEVIKKDIDEDRLVRPIELRMLQINTRQHFFRKHPLYDELNKVLSLYEYDTRICLAQTWSNEMAIFEDVNFCQKMMAGELFVFMAPHVLKKENVEALMKLVKTNCSELPIHMLSNDTIENGKLDEFIDNFQAKPGLIICTLRGILCEIYPYFSKVFVGGGHGKGIHSVLEPFVAGAQIFCGPNVKRSTEYDTIVKSGVDVGPINEMRNGYEIMKTSRANKMANELISDMIEESEMAKRKLIALLTN